MNVSKLRELLSQAIDCLEPSASNSPDSRSTSRSALYRTATHTPVPAPNFQAAWRPGFSRQIQSTNSGAGPSSISSERNALFNIGGRNCNQGKRKGSVRAPAQPAAKRTAKTKLAWYHDFICLAKAEMDVVPSATERSKLLSAGT